MITTELSEREKRYTYHKAAYRDKNYNPLYCYFLLEDRLPLLKINDTLMIRQKRRQKLSASETCQVMKFLNFFDLNGIHYLDVDLNDIYEFLVYLFTVENASFQTIKGYITILSAVYSNLIVRGEPIHESIRVSNGKGPKLIKSRKDKNRLTYIPGLIKSFHNTKERRKMPLYTKWYTPEQIKAIAAELPLVYRCIYLDTVFTGHRIDSALSLTLDSVNLKEGTVEPTRSKTGQTHVSPIPKELVKYMRTMICCAKNINAVMMIIAICCTSITSFRTRRFFSSKTKTSCKSRTLFLFGGITSAILNVQNH